MACNAVLVLDGLNVASKSNLDGDVQARQLPRVVKVEPVVRILGLVSIDNSM